MKQFEREYRDTLGSLRFSSERKEQIMKNLVERSEQKPVKRHIRPLRAAAIAACLVLALVGTAFAAANPEAVAQFFRVTINWEGDTSEVSGGEANYTVTGGTGWFPVDSFSQEVRDMAEQHEAKSFLSWDELEEFVGRKLMDNPVLEAGSPGHASSSSELKECATHILLTTYADELGLLSMWGQDNYCLDGVQLDRRVLVYTDVAHKSFTDTYGEDYEPEVILYHDRGNELSEEEYITPSGLTVSIVRVEKKYYTEFQAHCSVNGVRCWITAAPTYEPGREWNNTVWDGPDHTLAVLKTVLDGFIV